MTLTLADVLADPWVGAALPELLTGPVRGALVRWVHTSEQLDIAPLLRGGELLLTEALELRHEDESGQLSYLDSLADRGIAALAIETTTAFPVVPPAMVDRARERGLPVVHLRRRVPFVQMCESVNSQLADASLHRLRLANQLSVTLSDAVGSAAGVEDILGVLARETGSTVVLTAASGRLLGRASPLVPSSDASSAVFSAPITFGGAIVATLTLEPGPEADIHSIGAAVERAPEILGIALASEHPPSDRDRSTARALTLLLDAEPDAAHTAELRDLLRRLGLSVSGHVGGFVAVPRGSDVARRLSETVAALGRDAIGQVHGEEFIAVLTAESADALAAQQESVARSLRELAAQHPRLRTCLVAPSTALDPGRFAFARRLLESGGAAGPVIDARDHALAWLGTQLSDSAGVREFIAEQIGGLLGREEQHSGDLFATLVAFIAHDGSKTRTARALGIQRQTLYSRLERVESALGTRDARHTGRLAIIAAVVLEEARRRSV